MIKHRWIGLLAALLMAASVAFVAAGYFAPSAFKNLISSRDMPYVSAMDKTKVLDIEIIADEKDWANMLENATDEEYIRATIVINGEKIKNVGIRPKGNSSLSTVARDDTTDRYSFKIEFDHYIDGKTWLGLDKMVVNNMQGDASYMKEYLSYDIMDYVGVASPLYAFANISVNGESWGFYLAVEALEDSYAKRVYGNDHGKLYKPESMGMRGAGRMNEFLEGLEGDDGLEENAPAGEAAPNAATGGQNQPPPGASQNTQTQGGFTPPAQGGQGGTTPSAATDGQNQTAPDTSQNTQTQSGFTPPAQDGQRETAPSAPTDGQNQTAPGDAQNPQTQGGFTPPAQGGQGEATPNAPTDGQNQTAPDASQNTQTQGGFTPPAQGGQGRQNGGAANGGGFGSAGNGVSLAYTDDEISSYSAIFENAVFKSTDRDYERVIASLKKLSAGEDLDSVVDVEATLRYFAAHTVIVNLDSYVSNMGHNYYLYEKDGQLTMLPWDFNLAFGGFQSGDASSVVNFPIDTPVSGVSLEDRPILGKLLEVPEYLALYHSYLREIVDGYFNSGHYAETVDFLDSLICSYVENDPSAFYDYAAYQSAVVALKELGELRAKSIEGQLDGTIPATMAGQKENPGALVDASGLNLSALGTMGGGGGFGGGGLGGGERPAQNGDSRPESAAQGMDRESMQKAMEIVRAANGADLSAEQVAELEALGLTTEQIDAITAMGQKGFGGARPGAQENAAPDADSNANPAAPPLSQNSGSGSQTAAASSFGGGELIVLGSLSALLLGGLIFVIFYKRRRPA